MERGVLAKDDSPLELFEDRARMTIRSFYDSIWLTGKCTFLFWSTNSLLFYVHLKDDSVQKHSCSQSYLWCAFPGNKGEIKK